MAAYVYTLLHISFRPTLSSYSVSLEFENVRKLHSSCENEWHKFVKDNEGSLTFPNLSHKFICNYIIKDGKHDTWTLIYS